ncbi:hypothetical protein CALCODRAFT_508239 [Calocera cornea HHB12733]|uniref:BTB domain-containing protein n=1 Tax=Calocera cornea HHB12733 TaxID=1353952 RepID=A0A165GRI5_9BASI|nr:hypothetical protein CALCODRAFT_508239 [Calocera cornea HHB12733]
MDPASPEVVAVQDAFPSNPPPEPFVVPAIFQNPDADIVVKSSDNVEFRVWKCILIEGSVVFKDMLSSANSSQDAADPVPWPEPAKVIDRLLMLMYPVVKPALDSIEEIFTLIHAADKWQIDVAIAYLKENLMSRRVTRTDTQYFQIYAFACSMNFLDVQEDVVKMASNLDPLGPDVRRYLADMTALDLLRLVKLRTYPLATFDSHFSDVPQPAAQVAPGATAVPEVFQDPDADIAILSSDGIEYRVFKLYLCHSSEKLRDMVHRLGSERSNPAESTLPKLSIPLPAATLETLLCYIYPMPKRTNGTMPLEHLMVCLRAAITWDIRVAVEALSQELTMPWRLRSHPLRIYGFAASTGLAEEAAKAKGRAMLLDPLSHPLKVDFMEMTARDLAVLHESHALRNNAFEPSHQLIRQVKTVLEEHITL